MSTIFTAQQQTAFRNDRALVLEALAHQPLLPCISVIMPVYNPPIFFLKRAVESMLQQWYEKWELCIADDASTDGCVRDYLASLETCDARIRITYREHNGHISRATNTAASLATGAFLAFLDQDDALTPDCLARISLRLAACPDVDLLFTDDDKIDANDVSFAPQYKFGYDPYQLLSFMQFGHMLCVRKRLFDDLGGFRAGFEGAQDYDFSLRAVEQARSIAHVPSITYHWRSLPGSTAAGGDEKPYSFAAGLAAVQESLHRRGSNATVKHPEWARQAGCGLFGLDFPRSGPEVAIIIPVTQNDDISKKSIEELLCVDYETASFLFVLANTIDETKILSLTDQCTFVRTAISPENTAALCNAGVHASNAPYVLFLAAWLTPHASDWLRQMVGFGTMPGVGCVGGKVFGTDSRIRHAGYLHGLESPDLPGRIAYGEEDAWGHHFRLVTPARCSAVSGVCLLTKRKTFLCQGSFDEQTFPRQLFGADYGYRLGKAGLHAVCCPEGRFSARREASTLHDYDLAERNAFISRYRGLKGDVPPHIAEGRTDFAIRPYAEPLALARPLRVTMLTHGLALEGAPRSFFELCQGLTQKGYISPTIISHKPGALHRDFVQEGLPLFVFPPSDSSSSFCGDTDLSRYVSENISFLDMRNPSVFLKSIERAAEAVAATRPEVIFCNTILTFWGVLVAQHLGLPAVWVIRESEAPFEHFAAFPSFAREAVQACLSIPYRVVFVAHATRRLFGSFEKRHNFTVIHNALSESFGNTAPSPKKARRMVAAQPAVPWNDGDAPLVLMLGSVFERKGQEDFVKVWASLPDQVMAEAKFLIVGDRPGTSYSLKLHRLMNSLPPHRRNRVAILPETTTPELFYQAADVFVCCSRFESFPRVILEAMHSELPIITTNVFGIAEQVTHGYSALFFTPGNTSELAAHLIKLLNNPAMRQTLGRQAKLQLQSMPQQDAMLSCYAKIFQESAFYTGE